MKQIDTLLRRLTERLQLDGVGMSQLSDLMEALRSHVKCRVS